MGERYSLISGERAARWKRPMPVIFTIELNRNVKTTHGDHSPTFSVTGDEPFGATVRVPPSSATVIVIGVLMTGGSLKSLLYGPKTSVSIVPLFDSSRTSSTENSFLFFGAKNGSDV